MLCLDRAIYVLKVHLKIAFRPRSPANRNAHYCNKNGVAATLPLKKCSPLSTRMIRRFSCAIRGLHCKQMKLKKAPLMEAFPHVSSC